MSNEVKESKPMIQDCGTRWIFRTGFGTILFEEFDYEIDDLEASSDRLLHSATASRERYWITQRLWPNEITRLTDGQAVSSAMDSLNYPFLYKLTILAYIRNHIYLQAFPQTLNIKGVLRTIM